jgi:molecular chaperone HtpG
MDLFNPERKTNIKLYVKRVFITDDCDGLLPPYLRFVKGVVDSEDLPLNISREMFQHNPALAKIKKALTKRILGELKKKCEKEPKDYETFWKVFGSVLKEGLYEDFENRDKLMEIARFNSTYNEELINLKDYVERAKPGQEAIYYITGEDATQTALSPQLEGFKAKGVEVLLLTDPVDEFWITSVGNFEEKPFKSATKGGADLSKVADKKGKKDKKSTKKDTKKQKVSIDPLLAAFKLTLGDKVKDVRASERLTNSPVCLVADEGDMDIHLERLLKQHKQMGTTTPRVLEINADHILVKTLNKIVSKSKKPDPVIEDAAWLLLDQARIVEGEKVDDPSGFVRRMTSIMEKGLPMG